MRKKVLELFFLISIFFVLPNNTFAVEEGASCEEWKKVSSDSGCQTTYSYGKYAKVETTPGGFYQLRIPFKIVVSCDREVGKQAIFDQYMTGAANPYVSYENLGEYGDAGSNSEVTFKTLYLTDDTDDVVIEMTEDDIENFSKTTSTSGSPHTGSPWNSSSASKIPETDDVKDVIDPRASEQPENPAKVYKVYNPYSIGDYDYYYQLPGQEGGYKLDYDEKTIEKEYDNYIGDSYSYSNSCGDYSPPSTPCPQWLGVNSPFGEGYIASSYIYETGSCASNLDSKYEKKVCEEKKENSSGDSESDGSSKGDENSNNGSSSNEENCTTTECKITRTRCNCNARYTIVQVKRIYYVKMYITVTDTYTGEYVLPMTIPPEFSERFDAVRGKFVPLSTLTGDYKYTISFNKNGSDAIGKCDLIIKDSTEPDPPIPDIPWNKLIGFRTVDLNNMFPGRNPKKNWQGYDTSINIVKSTSSPMYVINLTSKLMRDISKSNSLNLYVNWGQELNHSWYHPMVIVDGIKTYDYNSDYKSSFVSNLVLHGYIKRFEDNIIARNKQLIGKGYNEYYTNKNYLENGDEEQ